MAHGLPSCVIVMRVLKDICQRVPAWGVLDTWVMNVHSHPFMDESNETMFVLLSDAGAASTKVYFQCKPRLYSSWGCVPKGDGVCCLRHLSPWYADSVHLLF